MKEVKSCCYARPYSKIPYPYYIQSPIGLVSKDNGANTRLIFHLLYPKIPNSPSVNASMPSHLCTVKYPDFCDAIRLCMEVGGGRTVHISSSDISAAFRNLGILKRHWRYLIMKAKSPIDGCWYYFVEKCLSFGASILCHHFQEVSNCVAHIVKSRIHQDLINYLDDCCFIHLLKQVCNGHMREFLDVCNRIGLPISPEKTIWASTLMVFLGFLIDTLNKQVLIPCEKIARGRNMINFVLKICAEKKAVHRKITVLQLQKICGFLNFIGRAILPDRAFTRRLYAKLQGSNGKLLPHYHIRVTEEMKRDLEMWDTFLQDQSAYCRTFMDFSATVKADDIAFAMDASKNLKLGFGGRCGKNWMFAAWNGLIKKCNPSIEYLELFALVAGVVAWIYQFQNRKVILYTDNQTIFHMINKTSGSCKSCMVLIRILVIHCLKYNVRVYT